MAAAARGAAAARVVLRMAVARSAHEGGASASHHLALALSHAGGVNETGRAAVQALALAVPTSNEEHRGTVQRRAGSDTDTDTDGGTADGATRVVVGKRVGDVDDSGSGGAWTSGTRRATHAAARDEREVGVENGHDSSDALVGVVVQLGPRTSQLVGERAHLVLGNVSHGHRGDVAVGSRRVVRLETLHNHIAHVNVETIRNTLGQVFEDFSNGEVVGNDKVVVELSSEAKLHEGRARRLGRKASGSRGRNDERKARRQPSRRNCGWAGSRGGRLENNAGGDELR